MILVLSILQTLRLPRDGGQLDARRKAFAGLAIRAMRTVIRPRLPLLASLALDTTDDVLAGPPFDLDPAMLQLGSDANLARRQLDTLEKLSSVYATIEQDPTFPAHASHKTTLANLRIYDTTKRATMEQAGV